MKKLILLILLVLLSACTFAHAGGGGGKAEAPSAPPPPPPPPTPQAPSDPNTANAVAREKTRRAQGGGNQSTLLTGNDGASPDDENISKTTLGGNVLLGG